MHKTRTMMVAALVLCLGSVAWAQSPLKVGVFDSQRVLEQTAEGKRVQAELNVLREANVSELQGKQREIEALQSQLQQQALSLSPDKRTTMEMDIQRKLLELNTAKEVASQMLQLELNTAQQRFNDRLLAVVDAFGREGGFSLILDISLVAFASPSTDVTTAIADRFDGMFPASAGGDAGAGN